MNNLPFDRNNSIEKKKIDRDSIIGLGEASFRKNYYSELQEKIHDLEQIIARNQGIITTMPDLLLLYDLTGNVQIYSDSACSEDPVLSIFLNSPDMNFLISEPAKLVRRDHNFLIKEFQIDTHGKSYYFEGRFRTIESNEVLIIIRNITTIKQMILNLQETALLDSLTNLYNRRVFEKKMRHLNLRNISKISVISIDINGLKFINDTLGHLAGDSIIKKTAELISTCFPERCLKARVGGDEFAIITEGLSEKEIEKKLKMLSKNAEQLSELANLSKLSLSYGYGFHQSGIVNMQYLFQTADDHMYQSKLLMKESIRGTFVKTFMKALEAKDYVSEGHTERMEDLAVLISEDLDLHQDQIDRIILLTKFHDIGKIGIPDNILKKPGKLTNDEWKVMRSHTSIGERIAFESIEIRDIAPLILHHHERYDGKGYPSGISGEDIPIEDRILCIVDSFDAMTNDRPYHKAITTEEAVKEIIECSQSQFDPVIVDSFLRVYKKIYA